MTIGKRFSHLYLSAGIPVQDSHRFRNRLASFYWEYLHEEHKDGIQRALQSEAGINIPYPVSYTHLTLPTKA